MDQEQRPTKQPMTMARIDVPKAHDVLANHLREVILRGEIAEGSVLPSERDLVEQTGLSRGAVREALRTLSIEGLIETRHGRFGGSVVTLPGHESMASAINRFVQGRKIPRDALHETRDCVEPALARMAATRRTEKHLKELRSLHEQLVASVDDFQEFSRINVLWHNTIARASGNELLSTFMMSISSDTEMATTTDEYDNMETRQLVINIHARINSAIEAQNPDLAERSMRQHMTATHAQTATPDTKSKMLSTSKKSKTTVQG